MAGGDGAASSLPALVIAFDHGPLLAASGGDRWLLGTAADRPDPAAVEDALAADGRIGAPLEVDGRALRVWTRLQAGAGRRDSKPDQLQAPLTGWRWQRGDQAWWGGSLDQLDSLDGPERKGSRHRQEQLEAVSVPDAALRWALDGPRARALLTAWQPWQRLTALAGGPLSEQVEGLALALKGEPGALVAEGRLDFGAP
jgi:hypothetical protein